MQCSKTRLLDHLVGAGDERRWNGEAERPKVRCLLLPRRPKCLAALSVSQTQMEQQLVTRCDSFNSASPSQSCPPSGLTACADTMLFYSFDSNNLSANIVPLTTPLSFDNNVPQISDRSCVFRPPHVENPYTDST